MDRPRFGLNVDLRRLRPERPPVFLLAGLDLLRPLGFAGIPVIVGSPHPRDPALASRYCHGRCVLPPLDQQEALAGSILAVGDRLASVLGRRVPLFYGNDDYLDLIYTYREELSHRFLLLLNDPEVARALLDKPSFESMARDRGIPVPRSLTWDDAGPDALSRAQGPVLAKPRIKVAWDDSAVLRRLFGGAGKARIFESGRAALEHPLVIHLKDHLAFQEYIPGDDRHLWSFHGFADEKARLLASFVGRKIRTYPALTGMSTFLELAVDRELEAIGPDIVARVPLKGIFKIDLKKDARDGRLHVLEINARYNLWHHLAARNGVNLPQAAYDYLVHGAQPPAQTYRTNYRWLHLRSDYKAFRELRSRGELSLARWLLSLGHSRKVYHLFSWTDPRPFLRAGVNQARWWLQRGLGYVGLRLRQWLSTAS